MNCPGRGWVSIRALQYENRMNKIKSLSFHIMLYFLYCGVTKYIVYSNTFSSIFKRAILHAIMGMQT